MYLSTQACSLLHCMYKPSWTLVLMSQLEKYYSSFPDTCTSVLKLAPFYTVCTSLRGHLCSCVYLLKYYSSFPDTCTSVLRLAPFYTVCTSLRGHLCSCVYLLKYYSSFPDTCTSVLRLAPLYIHCMYKPSWTLVLMCIPAEVL